MESDNLTDRGFDTEFVFSFSRSSGPGGQNVNKVSSKVELRFNIKESLVLTDLEKEILISRLKNRVNAQGELVLVCQTERTQLKNREKAAEKFYLLLEKALTPRKKRIKTTPSMSSREKRIEEKKIISRKKILRKDGDLQDTAES